MDWVLSVIKDVSVLGLGLLWFGMCWCGMSREELAELESDSETDYENGQLEKHTMA
jgi:hypothetical protein